MNISTTYHIFEGEIDASAVSSIIDFVQNTPGEIAVAINSSGGKTSTMRLLLHVLNQNKDRVTLIGLAGIFSAAFELFYSFEGRKAMTNGCRGMYHYSYCDVAIAANGKPENSGAESELLMLKQSKIREDSFVSRFLTSAELRKFKQNGDVFFSFERMKQIFPDAEIL